MRNSNKKLIIFRTDSSDKIGGGHLTRCINIGNNLRKQDVEVFFLCQDLPGLDIKLLKNSKHNFYLLKENKNLKKDALETIKFLEENNLSKNILVVDHYGIDYKWEKLVSNYIKKIIVIDDLASNKHECDILINQVYGIKESSYKQLINKSCKLYLGSDFIMIKPEFASLREKSLNKNSIDKIENIHLFFSSNDKDGLTLKYSKLILENFPFINLHISVGNNFENIFELKELQSKTKRISLVQNNLKIEKQMIKCQIAIGTPGMITWERACLGLPSIQIGIKDFQDDILSELDSLGICKWIGLEKKLNKNDFLDIFKLFLTDKKRLLKMKKKCLEVIDGKGMERVINILLQNI